MIELRDESVRVRYILDKCGEIFGDKVVVGNTSFIDEGVMNFIYKVETSEGDLFFKQALIDVKNKGKVKQDLASIPHQRIKYEKNVIDKLPCYAGWLFTRIIPNGEVNSCLKAHRIPVGSLYSEKFNKATNRR